MTSIYETPAGWVYLVTQTIRGVQLHKVGITRNPSRRMRELGNPEVVRMVPTLAPERIERIIHRDFSHCRWPQSEWFHLNEAELAEVKRCLDYIAAKSRELLEYEDPDDPKHESEPPLVSHAADPPRWASREVWVPVYICFIGLLCAVGTFQSCQRTLELLTEPSRSQLERVRR